MKKIATGLVLASVVMLGGAFGGCQTTKPAGESEGVTRPTTMPMTRLEGDKAASADVKQTVAQLPTLRVKAGEEKPFTDSKGLVWAADTGFEGGATVTREEADVKANGKPELFKSEHHSMTSWSTKLPNGEYVVKLYFAETYSGVTDETGRVFTYDVVDGDASSTKSLHEMKDFSIWKMAGGGSKAYIDSFDVKVTSGELSIKFTEGANHPEINAIEVLPK